MRQMCTVLRKSSGGTQDWWTRRGRLLAWIDDAIDFDLISIMLFAHVSGRDIESIKNAIESFWSDGQAEGQINCLKRSSAQNTAGAGPELLRARMPRPPHTK